MQYLMRLALVGSTETFPVCVCATNGETFPVGGCGTNGDWRWRWAKVIFWKVTINFGTVAHPD